MQCPWHSTWHFRKLSINDNDCCPHFTDDDAKAWQGQEAGAEPESSSHIRSNILDLVPLLLLKMKISRCESEGSRKEGEGLRARDKRKTWKRSLKPGDVLEGEDRAAKRTDSRSRLLALEYWHLQLARCFSV